MVGCVCLQFTENRGPFQLFADAGAGRINRRSPGSAVFLVNELRYRDPRKVGVSHELRAVEVGAAKCFNGEVDRSCRALPKLGEVIPFQNVQYLNQRRPTGGWWRRADNVVTAVGSVDGLALLHLIVSEIV